MNAADVTHALKLIGGNTRMWVGVVVIAALTGLFMYWLEQERWKHTPYRFPGDVQDRNGSTNLF